MSPPSETDLGRARLGIQEYIPRQVVANEVFQVNYHSTADTCGSTISLGTEWSSRIRAGSPAMTPTPTIGLSLLRGRGTRKRRFTLPNPLPLPTT